MTDYAKFVSRFVYSKNSDYSDPKVDTKSLTTALTPDEWEYREIECVVGGTTVDLGHFTSVTGIAVFNLSTTEYVVATFTSGVTANSVQITAPGHVVLANIDVDVSADLGLTAETAAAECVVAICGT